MTDHITEEQFDCYRRGQLSAAALQQCDAHLQSCAACQTHWAEHPQTAASFAALQNALDEPAVHLSYDDLAAYVDNELSSDALTRADMHLRECRACLAELNDLRAFRLELDLPAAPLSQPVQPAWRERWRALFVWRWALPFAATAACLLAALLLARRWPISDNENSAPPQLAQAPIATPAPIPSIPNTAVIVSLRDGAAQVTLDEQGQLSGLPTLNTNHQQFVAAALKSGKIALTAVPAELRPRGEILLGTQSQGESLRLIAPIGQVVLSQRPTLRWQALPGATSYRVAVYTTDYETVAQSEPLTATSWTAPVLKRDRVYLWQVIATKDGQEIKAPVAPAPEARFKILKQSLADEIAAARDSSLLTGLLYAQAGMYAEAEDVLQKLARQNPQASVAQQLLHDLRAQRRRQLR